MANEPTNQQALEQVSKLERGIYGFLPGNIKVYPSKLEQGGCCSEPQFWFEVYEDNVGKLHKLYDGKAVLTKKNGWTAEIQSKNWSATTEVPGCCGGVEVFKHGSADSKGKAELIVNPKGNTGYIAKGFDGQEKWFILADPSPPVEKSCCGTCCPKKEKKAKKEDVGCCDVCCPKPGTVTASSTFDVQKVSKALKASADNIHGMNLYKTTGGQRDIENPKGYFDFSTVAQKGCCFKQTELYRKDCVNELGHAADRSKHVHLAYGAHDGTEKPSQDDNDIALAIAVREAIRITASGSLTHMLSIPTKSLMM